VIFKQYSTVILLKQLIFQKFPHIGHPQYSWP